MQTTWEAFLNFYANTRSPEFENHGKRYRISNQGQDRNDVLAMYGDILHHVFKCSIYKAHASTS